MVCMLCELEATFNSGVIEVPRPSIYLSVRNIFRTAIGNGMHKSQLLVITNYTGLNDRDRRRVHDHCFGQRVRGSKAVYVIIANGIRARSKSLCVEKILCANI